MWNLNNDVIFISNFDVFVLKMIIIVVWNMKFSSFFVHSNRVHKFFWEFSNSFFHATILISFIREFIFFDVNTFNKTFFISKNSFDNFDKFKQRELFFWKEMLFSLFNDWFFRERLIISLLKFLFEKKTSISWLQ
jgi:hypothetical protein